MLQVASATIRRGEPAVLLGRSGSGKSTVLDLPDVGEIAIDGVEITRLSEWARTLFRRDHLGFVFQFFNLIPPRRTSQVQRGRPALDWS